MSVYTYSISSDFKNGFDINIFDNDIKNDPQIITDFLGLLSEDDDVAVNFDQDLSQDEQDRLDYLVSVHDPSENPMAPLSGTEYYIIKETLSIGSNAGTSNTDWTARQLNILQSNSNNNNVSLSNNQFTVQPGNWIIQASAPGYSCGNTQIRLYNVTDSVVNDYGTSEYVFRFSQVRSFLTHTFSITEAKTYQIEQICGSSYAYVGLGLASGHGPETYATVTLIKTD